jgi:hypothetical protein
MGEFKAWPKTKSIDLSSKEPSKVVYFFHLAPTSLRIEDSTSDKLTSKGLAPIQLTATMSIGRVSAACAGLASPTTRINPRNIDPNFDARTSTQ